MILAFCFVYFVFIVGFQTVMFHFIEDESTYKRSILYVAVLIMINLISGIKIAFVNRRIYNTFKQSFNGEIHNETKQILSYISIFAGNSFLSFLFCLLVLLDESFVAFLLGEMVWFS